MGYAFDNASDQATEHHAALADLLDTATRAFVDELIDVRGKRCLDVGAGAGSVATWLAGRAVEVVATDIAPQHVPSRPGLTVRRHDILEDQPPTGFDLVHARLLLAHLPRREHALRRLTEALAPGGVLLTGDFALAPGPFTAYGPDAGILTRYLKTHVRVLENRGNDPGWPYRSPAAFTAAGLEQVGFRVHGGSWAGGSPGCRLLLAGIPQLRAALLEDGLTEAELTATVKALANPRNSVNGFLFVQTSGRLAR
ncbi:methyltransferase domain-containing protein [Symbioplanes lichenis]|uniref:methyltransferase domain-containing protein n=1 Tax=Symbioplanes lichenis TaxID=1629072 RepID=UPI0027396B2B|nr:methyltransferase domain-containing protein [Actinoplanes lichenis]